MSLFGNIDIDDIPDDPFFIPQDTYLCILTEANTVDTDNDKHGFAIKWTVDDPDSEYNNFQIQEWHNLYPGVDAEDLTAQMKRNLSSLKKRLLDLGVAPNELGLVGSEDGPDLTGILANVTVKVTRKDVDGEEKVYTNVTKVVRVED